MADLQIIRSYVVDELETGDGRTICGRIVPYGEPAIVADRLPNGTMTRPYREVIARGACRNIVRAPGRVLLNYEHAESLLEQIGPAQDLREAEDGCHAVFRAFPTPSGDQGLEMIRSGYATGFSVEAIATEKGTRRLEDGTIERHLLKQLLHVALCREPAYAGAGVTALRSAPALEAVEIAAVRARQAELRLRFSADS